MIKVIGKRNCSACVATTRILNNKNIEFEYLIFDELCPEEKEYILNLAKLKSKTSMPIIIKDNNVVELKEVI